MGERAIRRRVIVALLASAPCLALPAACSTFDEEAPSGDAGPESATTTTTETGTDSGCAAPSRVGLFDPTAGRFMLFPENKAAPLIELTIAAAANTLPVAGHWTAGSLDTVGYRTPADGTNFFLLSENKVSAAVTSFSFGASGTGTFPFAGDWSGKGTSDVGIYFPDLAAWFLKNGDGNGGTVSFNYGAMNDAGTPRPVAGQFKAASKDSIAIFDFALGTFFLKYAPAAGNADLTIKVTHTGKGVWPIAGDWDGCGPMRLGVWDDSQGTFYLLRENREGSTEDVVPLGGAYANHGYVPIAGRWKP